MYTILKYVYNTQICIQYSNIYTILKYIYNTQIYIQYSNMYAILKYVYNTQMTLYFLQAEFYMTNYFNYLNSII